MTQRKLSDVSMEADDDIDAQIIMDNLAQELSSSKERLHNITEEYGEDTEKASSALHAIGKILFESGQYSESEKFFEKALDIVKRISPGTLVVSLRQENLGYCLKELGRSDEARDLLTDALELREQIIGAGHIYCATCLNEIAQIYFSSGDYSQAETFARKILDICQRYFGDTSIETALCMNNVAACIEMKEHTAHRGNSSEVYMSPRSAVSTSRSTETFSTNQTSFSGMHTQSSVLGTVVRGKSFEVKQEKSVSISSMNAFKSPRQSSHISALLTAIDMHDRGLGNKVDRPPSSSRRASPTSLRQLDEALELYGKAQKILQGELRTTGQKIKDTSNELNSFRPGTRDGNSSRNEVQNEKKRRIREWVKSRSAVSFLLGHINNQMAYIKDTVGKHEEAKVHNYESLLQFNRSIVGDEKELREKHARKDAATADSSSGEKAGRKFRRGQVPYGSGNVSTKSATSGAQDKVKPEISNMNRQSEDEEDSRQSLDLDITKMKIQTPAEAAWEVSFDHCMFERIDFSRKSGKISAIASAIASDMTQRGTDAEEANATASDIVLLFYRETLPLETVTRVVQAKRRARSALQRTSRLEMVRKEIASADAPKKSMSGVYRFPVINLTS